MFIRRKFSLILLQVRFELTWFEVCIKLHLFMFSKALWPVHEVPCSDFFNIIRLKRFVLYKMFFFSIHDFCIILWTNPICWLFCFSFRFDTPPKAFHPPASPFCTHSSITSQRWLWWQRWGCKCVPLLQQFDKYYIDNPIIIIRLNLMQRYPNVLFALIEHRVLVHRKMLNHQHEEKKCQRCVNDGISSTIWCTRTLRINS